eukprot:TRINITY_DN9284_c0_g1_i1.p1 TRINITY_DN9284_c0_g1~~TRINITY_DN9284_c0_g1_i1.p1  ORF type:complete len:386 (+),score=103.61 TRINITY_DN9284_c0_g1_i1:71-1228(+)
MQFCLRAFGDLSSSSAYLLLAFFLFLVGQGSYGGFIAAFSRNIRNFSQANRGKITGAMIGGFAISSGIYAQIYNFGFKSTSNGISHYLLMLAIMLPAILIIGGFLQLDASGIQRPVASADEELELREDSGIEEEDDFEPPIDSDVVSPEENIITGATVDVTGRKLIFDPTFLILWAVFSIGSGSGLMWINNVGSMGSAVGMPASQRPIIVGILAISNLTGRLFFGYMGDLLAHRLQRPWFLIISAIIMSFAHLLHAIVASVPSLYISTIFTGLAYGGFFTTSVTILSILFGTKFFSMNNSFLSLAPAGGGLAFGFIAGILYDKSDGSHMEGDEVVCSGRGCFGNSLIITSVMCILSIAGSIVLRHRIKKRLAANVFQPLETETKL